MNVQKSGDPVKGYCKCGSEVDCTIKVYSNATTHAHGKCPACGKTGAFQQRGNRSMEDFKHQLMSVRSSILHFEKNDDKDEAVAMLERLADDLRRECKW